MSIKNKCYNMAIIFNTLPEDINYFTIRKSMFKKYIPFLILFAANVNAEKLESIFVAPDVFITLKN